MARFNEKLREITNPPRPCKDGCGRLIKWAGEQGNTTRELACYDCEKKRRDHLTRAASINPRQRSIGH